MKATDDIALVESLRFAVPMWVHELRDCTPEQRVARAKRCAQVVAEHGDALQFKGESASARRSTRDAFNRLAEGLALLAFQDGGVAFAGHHWCVGSNHMGVPGNGSCDEELARVEANPRPAPVVRIRRPIIDVHLPDEVAS